MNNIDPAIFKAYDIRGKYPDQLNAEVVFKIAQAYVKLLTTSPSFQPPSPNLERGKMNIVVGTDMRLSGQEFKESITKALIEAGVNVIDIGLVSTDQFYFAVHHLKTSGGIMATASHNPKEYGGLKIVKEKAVPISGNSGIYEIRDMVVSNQYSVNSREKGGIGKADILEEYYNHVLSKFDVSKIKPLKIVANTNFGMATPAIDRLKKVLPIKFVEVINGKLDGSFPKGRPDPLRPETRVETSQKIKELKPDLGVAWDGDADRCFFFDEKGEFITPAYINALLSEYYLKRFPGSKIIHDTRVYRVIDFLIEKNGGISVPAVAGHSLIKEQMIKGDVIFGSETSGHYYYKENFYLDNGLFPFFGILEILSSSSKSFSEILKQLREKFYISEEINFKFGKENILEEIEKHFNNAKINKLDGLDICYNNWRVSLRKSNTENLLRMNLEAESKELLETKTKGISNLIESLSF